MEIQVIASGSAGNCYRISDGTTSLLIDPGIDINRIKKALNFNLSGVDGCLLSHEHGDHSKSILSVLRAGVNIYSSKGTIEALCLSGHRINTITAKTSFKVGNMKIMPFALQHDAAEPMGFLIQSGKHKILYATDTYYIRYKFPGLTHIMVECNYAKDILDANIEAGKVAIPHKMRLLQSHFSHDNVKRFLKANDLSKVQEIYLIHLSNGNSNEERFKREIQQLTGKQIIVC